jgi:hypothetical protein
MPTEADARWKVEASVNRRVAEAHIEARRVEKERRRKEQRELANDLHLPPSPPSSSAIIGGASSSLSAKDPSKS